MIIYSAGGYFEYRINFLFRCQMYSILVSSNLALDHCVNIDIGINYYYNFVYVIY